MYVHGVDLIRARDVNLPPPVNIEYPVYGSSGTNFLGTFYIVASFSTWQMTPSFTCPYPPCIQSPRPANPATRRHRRVRERRIQRLQPDDRFHSPADDQRVLFSNRLYPR
jgi:hypothetical protein